MSAAEQLASDEVLRTRIGLVTYLAPKTTVVNRETLEQLVATAEDCLERQEVQIVVDLGSVQVLSSAALDALLNLQDRLLKLGGALKVAHAGALLKEIFRITGFTQYVALVDSPVNDSPSLTAAPGAPRRLGDILLSKELITEARIEEALTLQKKLGMRMGQIIIDKGWVPEAEVLAALGEQLSVPFVRLKAGLYDPKVVQLLGNESARRLKVLPLFKVRGAVFLATADAQAIPTFDEVEERVGCRVQPVLAQREDILSCINEAYGEQDFSPDLIADVDDDFEVLENAGPDDYAVIDELASGSPVINMVNSIIQRAVRDGASDIHIEAFRRQSRIRFRIDGVLYEVMNPRVELHPALVSRLKVMANLDIAERRMPQDGRIQVSTQGRSVDLRFSSLPGLFGEKVVLRVLDKNQAILDVNKLGMVEHNLQAYKGLLERSFGLILVTGPTGSGKTTSLYAALNYLNSIEKNIVTIEDPVEYQIDIVNQNEVRNNIGLTFDKMLKHVLRQDPDVIMVGEIRERETAETAVQAALTGHLVLSTLHTNDSVGAVTRMIDMGVEPYLLSSALIGVVAQRLLRTVCPACKTTFIAPPAVIESYGWDDAGSLRLAKGRGCAECYDSGYKGRAGIHEVVGTEPALQKLIMSNPSRDQLTEYLTERGTVTLLDDGMERARRGLTTIEEVNRVVNV